MLPKLRGAALDVGGVIRTELEDWASIMFSGYDSERIRDALAKAWRTGDRCSDDPRQIAIDWAKTLIEMGELPGYAPEALIESARRSIDFVDREVTFRTLDRLRAAGIKLVVASNDHAWLYQDFFVERSGLREYFSEEVVSCFTGVTKSDPRFYADVEKALGVDPGECLFVDDRWKNVEMAGYHGFVPLAVSGPRYLETSLERWGII